MNDRVATATPAAVRVRIAGCVLDMAREELIDARGSRIDIRPQAYQVLRYLTLNPGRLVTKDELMAAVWPHVVVTDDSLVQAIGDVRRALADDPHELIKTIPRRGYMLVADAVAPQERPAPDLLVGLPQESRDAMALAGSARGHDRALKLAMVAVLAVAMAFGVWWAFGERHQQEVPAAIKGRPSIAVLPFKDPLATTDGDLIARGIAQDLASELARSHDLRVVSHQSSFALAAQSLPVEEIGRRLRTRYLVDGTVTRQGEVLRVSLDLVDSQDRRIVWSSSQTLEAATFLSGEASMVSRIAGTVQSKLHRIEEFRALTHPPKTMDVYALTERGKAMMHRYDAPGIAEARRLFEQALAIDPDYAPAWAFLGMANMIDAGSGLTGRWSRTQLPEIIGQIQKAVNLEPDLPIAYVSLSQAQALARNFDAALASAQRCIDLAPNDPDCLFIMGKARMELGDVETAVRYMGEAVDLNPVTPAFLSAFSATALWGVHKLDAALASADKCLAMAPEFWRCRQERMVALVELGRVSEARAEAPVLMAQVPTMTAERFALAFADSARELRERRVRDAVEAGVPRSVPTQ